jgi:hypothetical protein
MSTAMGKKLYFNVAVELIGIRAKHLFWKDLDCLQTKDGWILNRLSNRIHQSKFKEIVATILVSKLRYGLQLYS